MRPIAKAKHLLSFFLACTASSGSVQAQGVDAVFEGPRRSDDWVAKATMMFGQGRSYAVLVGVSDYIGVQRGGFPPLEEAKNDVDRVRRFLIEQAGFDYVRVLTEDKVTKARLDEIMVDEMPRRVSGKDRFLFYWSGHGTSMQGANDSAVGFLPLKASPRSQYSSMIGMSDISRWDDLLKAKQALYIIDACLSGLAGVQPKSDPKELAMDQLGRPSRHLFAAGGAQEETIAAARWGGSLFTDSLIKAASGEAVQPGIPVISLSDILAYVRRRVAFEKDQARWPGTISPQLRLMRQSEGEFFFLNPRPQPTKPLEESQKVIKAQKKGEAGAVPTSAAIEQKTTEEKCFRFNDMIRCD